MVHVDELGAIGKHSPSHRHRGDWGRDGPSPCCETELFLNVSTTKALSVMWLEVENGFSDDL